MAIPVQHTVRVVDNVSHNGAPVAYPFKTVCSCQWEALALNLEVADAYCKWHVGAQARRGNPCEIVPYPKPEEAPDGSSGPVASAETPGEPAVKATPTPAPTKA